MATQDAAPEASAHEALHQLLEDLGEDGTRLPKLESDWSWLKEYWEALWLRISEWLPSFDNPLEGWSLHLNPEVLWTLLLAAFAITLLVLLVWLVVNLLRHGKIPGAMEVALHESPKPLLLEEQLSAALTAGQWSLALKYRWRLFLLRTRHPGSVTLQELFGAYCHGLSITDLYREMFDPRVSSTHKSYQSFDQVLAQQESPPL